jgi:hypothetical protein
LFPLSKGASGGAGLIIDGIEKSLSYQGKAQGAFALKN